MKKKFYNLFPLTLILLGCICSESCLTAMHCGIDLCIKQLIPALYLFLIAANLFYIPSSPKPAKGPFPKGFLSMLLLTASGGYPVGALCVRKAYENKCLSVKQAKALSCLLLCAGPGFCIHYIGTAVLQNTTAGILLLLSQYLSMLLGLAVYGILFHKTSCVSLPGDFPPNDLPQAVRKAARSMADICASVIFFFALRGMLDPLLCRLPEKCRDLISGLMEVTAGCSGITAFDGISKMLLIAFFCGFGGLGIHLQLYGILKEAATCYPLFITVRLLMGILTAAIWRGLLLFLPQTDLACLSMPNGMLLSSSSENPVIFFMLMFTCVTFCASFVTYLRR